MATSTTRLVLRKPVDADTVDQELDLNANYDIIDLNIGFRIVTSGTRPATPFQGMQIYETDTKDKYFWTGTEWWPVGPLARVKTADESVTSSTTLQNDDHLVIPVTANSKYAVEAFIMALGPATADLKIDWAIPASSFININMLEWQRANAEGQRVVLTGGAAGRMTLEGESNGLALFGSTFSTQSSWTTFVGQLGVVGTAGNLQFRWAQNTSDAGAVTLKAGSWLKITRVS